MPKNRKIELYDCPMIWDSFQYFELANQLGVKIEADKKILEQCPTNENKAVFNKNLLTYHILVVEGSTMNAAIAERNLEYQQDGWFIWLQIYNFYISGEPFKNIDEKFTYWFDANFDMHFGKVDFGGRYFIEAINNYKSGQYYSCVCGLFPLVEFFERRISKFDGESIFNIKKALDESQVKDLSGYKKYFEDFETDLNKFLKENIYAVSAESDKEPKVICRNRVLHGIFTRDINKTDCLKLFCIVKSMAQFANWLHSLEEIKRLKEALENK